MTMASSMFGTTYFTLTGFHGAHVFGGVLMLGVILYRGMAGQFSASHHDAVEAVSLYWHFVDVVWILLFSSSTCCSAPNRGQAMTPSPSQLDRHRDHLRRPVAGLLLLRARPPLPRRVGGRDHAFRPRGGARDHGPRPRRPARATAARGSGIPNLIQSILDPPHPDRRPGLGRPRRAHPRRAAAARAALARPHGARLRDGGADAPGAGSGQPVPPPDVHMPGGSAAPILAAFGAAPCSPGWSSAGRDPRRGDDPRHHPPAAGAARPSATTTTSSPGEPCPPSSTKARRRASTCRGPRSGRCSARWARPPCSADSSSAAGCSIRGRHLPGLDPARLARRRDGRVPQGRGG